MADLQTRLTRQAITNSTIVQEQQKKAQAAAAARARAGVQDQSLGSTVGNAFSSVGSWIADHWTDDFSSVPVAGPIASGAAGAYQRSVDGIAGLGTAAALAANPGYWQNRGQDQDLMSDAFGSGVTPGQAAVGLAGYIAGNTRNTDLTDEKQRDAMFTDGWGQALSGTADGAFTFFLDPTVLLGKFSKVYRYGSTAFGMELLGHWNMKVAGPRAVRAIETMADDELDAIARGEGTRTALGVEADRIAKSDFTDARDIDIFQGSNRDLLASIGATITDKRDAVVFAAAAAGSDKYARILGQEFPLAKLAFQRAWRNEYETRILNTPIGTHAPDVLDDLLESDVKALDVLADMRKRSPEYARMDSLERQTAALDDERAGAFGLIEEFGSRSKTAKQMSYAWRDGKMQRKAPVSRKQRDITPMSGTGPAAYESIYQLSSMMPRVRVWEWITGEHGNGYIDIAGFNDGKATDGLVAVLSDSRTLRQDGAWTRQQLNIYGAARNQQERYEAIQAIERNAMNRLAAQYGVKDRSELENIYNQISKNRWDHIQRFRDRGYGVDESGDIIRGGPVLRSQLQYSVPMLDMATLEKSVKIMSKPFYNMSRGDKARGYAATTKAAADQVLSLWKAAVLLRLGYTMRNTAEGWLRTGAYLGTIPSLKHTIGGTRNFASNNRARLWSHAPGIGARATGRAERDAIAAITEETDRLALARAQRDELLAKNPRARTAKIDKAIAEHQASIDALAERVGSLQAKLAKMKDRRYTGKGKGAYGVVRAKTRNGRIEADLNSEYADLIRKGASQERTKNTLLESEWLNGYNRELVDSAWTKINPGARQYFQELATAARQFREDEVARMVLDGADDGQIVKWLQSTEGRGYRQNMRVAKAEAPGKVAQVRGMLERYFPTEQSRALVAQREPTAGELELLLTRLNRGAEPDEAQFFSKKAYKKALDEWESTTAAREGLPELSPIHGREVAAALGQIKGVKAGYFKVQDQLFELLGSMPESTLVRHPFYAEVWDRRMQQLIKIADDQGRDIDEALLAKMNRSAHRTALTSTNEVLFTIERYSNPAYFLRWVMPFYAAWENSAKVWTRLVANDPSILARANILWNIPSRLGMVVDENGDPVEAAPMDFLTGSPNRFIVLPKVLGDRVTALTGGTPVKIPLGSLNVVTPGETPWLPGMGPLVTVPVGTFLVNKPDWQAAARNFLGDTLYNQIAPFGQPQTIGDVVPPWIRKTYERWQGEGNDAYLATAAAMMQTAMVDWYRSGGNPEDMPDMDSVLQRANDFYLWSAIFSLTLPVSTTRTSPYQVQIDDWRRLLQDDTLDYQDKIATFIHKWGDDYTPLTVSTSKSIASNLSPDQDHYEVLTKYDRLARELYETVDPSTVGILAATAPVGEFDSGVYTWLQSHGPEGADDTYRGRKNPMDMQQSILMSNAWRDYRLSKTKLDVELAKRKAAGGSASLSAKSNADLKAVWDDFVDNQMANEYGDTWTSEFNTFTNMTAKNLVAIKKVMSNEQFMSQYGSTPLWTGIREYVNSRQKVIDALAAGADREQIMAVWAEWVAEQRDSSLAFSDFYDSYLDQDQLTDYGIEAASG